MSESVIQNSRFGRLVALHRVESRMPKWKCACDCGSESEVFAHNLRNGKTVSCGCARSLIWSAQRTKHGLSRDSIYSRWKSIVRRCTKPHSDSYQWYGGRGIKVCDRWLKFENFVADMGLPPSADLEVDRIDNDGPYSPENCRWTTVPINRHNRIEKRDARGRWTK